MGRSYQRFADVDRRNRVRAAGSRHLESAECAGHDRAFHGATKALVLCPGTAAGPYIEGSWTCIAVAQGEATIEPGRVLDNLGREAVTAGADRRHFDILQDTQLFRPGFRDIAFQGSNSPPLAGDGTGAAIGAAADEALYRAVNEVSGARLGTAYRANTIAFDIHVRPSM